MKYCKKCGEIIEPGDSYCIFCGEPVSNDQKFIKPIDNKNAYMTKKVSGNQPIIIGILVAAVFIILFITVFVISKRNSYIGTWVGDACDEYNDTLGYTITMEFNKDNTGYASMSDHGEEYKKNFTYEEEDGWIWITSTSDSDDTISCSYEVDGNRMTMWDDDGVTYTLYRQ